MRIKTLIAATWLLLSGCSATLTSRDLVLDLQSPGGVPIGITMKSIDTSETGNTDSYNNAKNDIYTTLLSESKGLVGEYTDQPLLLSIAYRFKPAFDADAGIGILSFVLPFLAFVPEDNNEPYYVDYTVTDTRANIVLHRSLKGMASGFIKGYWVGRIGAASKLRMKEGEHAARNAARLVLKDIQGNMDKLVAAVNASRLAAAPSLPNASGAPDRGTSSGPSESAATFEEAKKIGTYAAYRDFLNRFPYALERKDALSAMAALVGKPKGTYDGYKKFVTDFPDGLDFVPHDFQLYLIGPEGMRVHDIIGLIKEGIEDTVIAAKIRIQSGFYKDFSVQEISALKKEGVPASIIEAMLDSTSRAKRMQEEERSKKVMESLLADIQRAQRRLEELKASQSQQVQTSAAREGEGNTAADIAKNCGAQIVALEACKQLPGLLQSACKATAKAKFPCE